MTKTANPRDRDGLRAEVYALRELSSLMEKNPWLERPALASKDYNGKMVLSFMYLRSYGDTPEEARKRVEQAVIDTVNLFPDVEWTANSPSPDGGYDGTYYELTGEWLGVTLRVWTRRADVCEQVVVSEYEEEVEVPDPEILKSVPIVRNTVKKQITEWQCNEGIATATNQVLRKRQAGKEVGASWA